MTSGWPKSPYKGFSYYGPADTGLYAGREDQIVEFARNVTRMDTRILILHGRTGCGKSSFLRAGVIPYLEQGLRGVQFVKEPKEDSPVGHAHALFVRSTDKPLERLADKVFEFCSHDYEFASPFGNERVKFSGALHGCKQEDEFVLKVRQQPRLLVESLHVIASYIPDTLVLVIDQGEEVLTLEADEHTEAARRSYFEFLALFGTAQFDLKLVIALRTEYFGLFVDGFRRLKSRGVRFNDYLLPNLEREDLLRAILRPTSTKEQDGCPGDHYRFSYADGLADRIVSDLQTVAKRGGLVGGALPLLQIVCETLYRKTAQRGEGSKRWVITFQDYAELGEIETQAGDYVDDILLAFYTASGVERETAATYAYGWKDSLVPLARTQVDNTVTTDIKKIGDLEPKGDSPPLPRFEEMLRYLSDDEQSVLRIEKVNGTDCFSLRHDAIGLVLLSWKNAREGIAPLEAEIRAGRRVATFIGIAYFIGLLVFLEFDWNDLGIAVRGGFGCLSLVMLAGAWANWKQSRKPRGLQVFRGRVASAEMRTWVVGPGNKVLQFYWSVLGVLYEILGKGSSGHLFRALLPGTDPNPLSDLTTNPVFRLYYRSRSHPAKERLDKILEKESRLRSKRSPETNANAPVG
jgi:hypothetical protein